MTFGQAEQRGRDERARERLPLLGIMSIRFILLKHPWAGGDRCSRFGSG